MKKYFFIALLVVAAVLYVAQKNKQSDTVEQIPPEDVSTLSYSDPGNAFSVSYPKEFTINRDYAYQLTPDQIIPGVKFTIPASMAEGTNLSSDSHTSVELLANENECSANRFLDGIHVETTETHAGKTFSVASASNAGAGNRYDETVYAISGGDSCIGVRYLIHHTVLANYEPGTRQEFDKTALLAQFDRIRNSLIVK